MNECATRMLRAALLMFTALLLTRKYVAWRYALVCERLIHSLVIEKKIRAVEALGMG